MAKLETAYQKSRSSLGDLSEDELRAAVDYLKKTLLNEKDQPVLTDTTRQLLQSTLLSQQTNFSSLDELALTLPKSWTKVVTSAKACRKDGWTVTGNTTSNNSESSQVSQLTKTKRGSKADESRASDRSQSRIPHTANPPQPPHHSRPPADELTCRSCGNKPAKQTGAVMCFVWDFTKSVRPACQFRRQAGGTRRGGGDTHEYV